MILKFDEFLFEKTNKAVPTKIESTNSTDLVKLLKKRNITQSDIDKSVKMAKLIETDFGFATRWVQKEMELLYALKKDGTMIDESDIKYIDNLFSGSEFSDVVLWLEVENKEYMLGQEPKNMQFERLRLTRLTTNFKPK